MNDLTKRFRRVAHALERLEETESMGPRARRNARAELRGATRRLLDAALERYPAPKVERAPVRRQTPYERIAALHAAGWDELKLGWSQRVLELAARGIRVVRVKNRNAVGGTQVAIFAPPWTKDVPAEKLAAAKRSVTVRNATKAVTKLIARPTP